jgi:PAS domain S-box-containing protein
MGKMIQTEQSLDSIINNLPDIIYRLDPEGKITFINSAVEKYGYNAEQLIGSKVLELIHPDDRESVQFCIMERRTGDRHTSNVEIRLLTKDRGHKHFEVHDAVLDGPVFNLDAQGIYITNDQQEEIFLGTQGVARDITERKMMLLDLKTSEEKYRMLYRETPAMLHSIDQNGCLISVSNRWLDVLGYARDEVLGRKSTDFLTEVSRNYAQTVALPDFFKTGNCTDVPYQMVKKSGEIIDVLLSATAENNAEGIVDQSFAVITDVTERKQAEEALLASETFLDETGQIAQVGGWEIDLKANTLKWTNEVYHIHEISSDYTPIVESAINFYIEDHQPIIKQVVEEAIASGKPFDVDLQICTAKDNLKWVRVKGYAIFEDCNVVKVRGALQDITERKEAEETLRKREETLQQSQKMEAIGKLAGGIAHDFNNHLMAMMANSELMLSQLDKDDPLAHYPEEILKIGQRSALLTRQLLAFGPISHKDKAFVMLSDLIQSSQSMLQRLIREDIEMRTIIQPDLGIVRADHGQMEQIILNLVLNARDAMPTGGKLTISAQNVILNGDAASIHADLTAGAYVTLSVEDTGTGIPTDHLDRIFEPYFTTKAIGEGTGLGLATVYGIAQQSGGVVTVHTVQGKGTKFSIYLPLINGSQRVEGSIENGKPVKGHGEQILLVEDEDGLRKPLKLALESFGYQVSEAKNGQTAISLLRSVSHPVDLVITDFIMPEINGIELAKHLQKEHPQTKVIFITGHTRDVIVPDDLNESNYRFMTKPFSTESLSKKIRELIET